MIITKNIVKIIIIIYQHNNYPHLSLQLSSINKQLNQLLTSVEVALNLCKPSKARPICWDRKTALERRIFSANFNTITRT